MDVLREKKGGGGRGEALVYSYSISYEVWQVKMTIFNKKNWKKNPINKPFV